MVKHLQQNLPSKSLNKIAENEPFLPSDVADQGSRALFWGGLGAGGGAVMRSLQHYITPRPKPYSPKEIIKRLQSRSQIGPPGLSGTLDLPVPYLEKPPLDVKAASSMFDLPVAVGAGATGLAGGYKLMDKFLQPPIQKTDPDYINKELFKAKKKYQEALLSTYNLNKDKFTANNPSQPLPSTKIPNPISPEEMSQMKLSSLLDKHYEKYAANPFLDNIYDPLAKQVSSYTNTANDWKNYLLGGTLALGAATLPAAYLTTKAYNDRTDPIKTNPDINDEAIKALRLTERERAKASPPGINVVPRRIPVYDIPKPEEQPKQQSHPLMPNLNLFPKESSLLVDFLFTE